MATQMGCSPAAARLLLLLLLLVVAAGASVAGAAYVRYKDPKQPIQARVADLLGRMTLEEKIGQMTQIERANASTAIIEKYFVGSVLSGGGSAPSEKASAATWQEMITKMQKAALSTRLGIPIIYGIDAVHGNNNAYNATIFPHNVGLGATRDPDLVKLIGRATALEARATGIPYTFAPCVAVCRDPRWGRCYESFSEDTKLVQLMTAAVIPGLQGDVSKTHPRGIPFVAGPKNVAGCAKHFVGDGGTRRGINENNTVLSFHDLMRIHMPPYYDAVIKGVASVMISYSSWNGVKMHENKYLITEILKEKMRFRGFVITDWEAVDKITTPPHKHYYHSIQETIHAGIDMVMVPYDYPEFVADVTAQAKRGAIKMDRINDAVTRILRVKFAMGLFENPLPDDSLIGQLGSKPHRELAREAVRKSLVLLKNGKGKKDGKPVLPLSKNAKKILVVGTHAHDLGLQCGGWTKSWQGQAGNNFTGQGTTILEAIKSAVDKKTVIDYSEHPDKGSISKNLDEYDYAVVAVGEHPYAETAGDNQNLTIPGPGPEVIRKVCELVKCVVVLVSGRPLVVEPYLDTMDALVAAWLPGTEGHGVADVLFGDYGFSGKLPRTWVRSVDQLPMNYGDKLYDPLFPFGFGLTTKPAARS